MRLSSSFPLFRTLLRHFSSNTNLPSLTKIPIKYRHQAIKEAQEVITDYLHTTRTLSFVYADCISKYAIYNLSDLISKVHYSSVDFPKTLLKYVRYNPINEFAFFYESIGIDYLNINAFLKPYVFFLSDNSTVLDVACTLAGFGFPWNKLGKLYVEEVSIFESKQAILGSKFDGLLALGFSNEQAVGICLAFPCLLKGKEVGLSVKFDALLNDLKRAFVDCDLERFEDVDVWYELCGKIKVFYDLGVEKGKVGERIGKNRSIFIATPIKVLAEKLEFFCKLGVGKTEIGLLLLSHPEILGINFDNRVISVLGFLNHFGFQEKELEAISQKYSYIFGRNKMSNLPHILRAMDLHEWFFHELKCGKFKLLANYGLSSPNEGEDKDYIQNLEKLKCVRTYGYSLTKLEFFHGIGFGENGSTMKLLVEVHGSPTGLLERFDFLFNEGIEFSKLCKMIIHTPEFLNQKLDAIKLKIDFLREEVGLSLEFLETFPAFLIYNLEKRIKPRYRFHVWLSKQGWSTKNYSLSGIVAIS